jgi:hypothetical protein
VRTLAAVLLLLLLPVSSASAQSPSVTLDKPGAGPVGRTIPVSATVTGSVDRVEFSVRGVVKLVDDSAPFGGNFDTSTVADGPATIAATAFSGTGDSAVATVDVVIDNTKPVLSVTGPDREAFVLGSTQRWSFSASDAGSGISHFRCSVRPIGTTPTFGSCTSAAEFVLSNQPEGTYTFSVRAADNAGNFAQQGRDFKIESPAAEATIAAATPGAAPITPVLDPPLVAAEKATAPQILVALGFSFTSTARATKLTNFVVKNVPVGATVTVTCPTGCAKKRFKKTTARGGRLLLKRVLKKKLNVGTEITVIVSKPGASSAVKVLTIRARKAPLVTTLCQPEGSSKPAAC